MKRITALLLTILMLWVLGSANADPISLKGLKETGLYELYSEVQAQLQLNQLRSAGNYMPLKDYDDIERNPSSHTNEHLYLEGTVIQVVEGESLNTYRITVDKNGDQVFMVTYALPEDSERFLVDDKVCVYGKFTDLYTYKSTTNLQVTVPLVEAALMIHPIMNKNVKKASQEELETALTDIREQISKTVKKDHDYTVLTKTNYPFFAKNVALHKNEKIKFSGKVLQALENDDITSIRVAVDNDSDHVVYLIVVGDLLDIRVLDDDVINVTGTYSGLYTYSSTRGGEITIPSCIADSVSVKGYKAPAKFTKDKQGNIKLTKQTYQDFSRRPKEHDSDPITFSAKVVQVIEGSSNSQYRMAVDNDYDSIIYVTLPNDSRTMRVLEDDKVTVVATFNGLLTYESTLGAPITIPQCIASSVVIPGKKATIAAKNADGNYVVNKDNYESFARDEDTYKGEVITFTAKVIQVVDGDSSTTYRLAVDKSYDAVFLAIIDNDELDIRILEDDEVTVEATSTGLYTYSSTMGGKITVPSCMLTKYTVNNYTKADLGSPDSNGNYKITKKNYQEIARNPDPYRLKGMTFKGKIVQVVEGNDGDNIYRVAVDSDSDCMFYVEYTLPSGASRMLENDTVTLTGTYYGIYSYKTTMGSTVSVPALIATDMHR